MSRISCFEGAPGVISYPSVLPGQSAADSRGTSKRRQILLLFPPFWPPLIPPMGLAVLKGRLVAEGYTDVKTADLNAVAAFQLYQREYFAALTRWIPKANLGVVGKLGHEVLQRHLLATVNSGNDGDIVATAVGEFVEHTFYVAANADLLRELNDIVARFFDCFQWHIRGLFEVERPAVLGLSVPGLATLACAQVLLALFKALRPDGLTILGGSVFLSGVSNSPDFERFLAYTALADHVIIGDGLDELLAILSGDGPPGRVAFATPPGNRPGSASRVSDPDYGDFELSLYPYIGTEQTISCPFECGFCNLPRFHGAYRKRPAELIAAELMNLHDRYGAQLIYMADSLLNPVIRELTTELRSLPIPLYIDGFLRAQQGLCDREIALGLRQGGLYRVRIGVESGSQRVLDLMDKRITVEQASGTVRAMADAGIKTTIYLVVGYPGETDEDFRATLDWIEDMQTDIWQVDCNPFTYWYSGQCEEEAWASLRRPLYSVTTGRLLPIREWTLDCRPARREVYSRMKQLVQFCEALGIADPHDMRTIHKADERWCLLHANAVPPLAAFQRQQIIAECRTARLLHPVQSSAESSNNFIF
jgi:radical SAM superfamily enzyme YgiQ (UPF0313 family)